jgi:hypothetical protein
MRRAPPPLPLESTTELPAGARRAALVFLASAAIILWLPVARALFGRPPGFLRDLGFWSGPRGTVLAWALALAVALLYSTFAVRNIPLVRVHWRAVSAAKALGIGAAFAAAIVEEAVFRRMLMDGLRSAGVPATLQVMASGVAFGAAHGLWGIVTGRTIAGAGAMVATGALGTALAVVYVIGDRSLAPVIVSHFVITATIQPGILFAAFSGQMPRPQPGWWRAV